MLHVDRSRAEHKCTRKPECLFVGEFGGWCARCDAEAHGDAHELPTPVGWVWKPPAQLELFERIT